MVYHGLAWDYKLLVQYVLQAKKSFAWELPDGDGERERETRTARQPIELFKLSSFAWKIQGLHFFWIGKCARERWDEFQWHLGHPREPWLFVPYPTCCLIGILIIINLYKLHQIHQGVLGQWPKSYHLPKSRINHAWPMGKAVPH